MGNTERATEIWEQGLGQSNPSENLYARLAQIYKEKKEYSGKKESYNASINNLFEDLIPALFDEIRRETENMKKALNEGDYENLARLAHGLKGAAGNYELVELSGIFLDIESAFKDRDIENVKGLMENVLDYIEKVKIEYVDED